MYLLIVLGKVCKQKVVDKDIVIAKPSNKNSFLYQAR